MAVARTMLSLAREEAAIITSEVATTARVTAVENVASSSKLAAEALNPLAVRQAAEAAVKESMEGSSLFASHLSLAPKSANVAPGPLLSELTTAAIRPPQIGQTGGVRTVLSEVIEADLGVSMREALSNATQTGVEEQLADVVDVAKVLQAGEGVSVVEAVAEIRGAAEAAL